MQDSKNTSEGVQRAPSDQSYQDGYDDGYKDGTEDTEAKYKEKIARDPGIKILSDYTRRQKELAMIEDSEIRNPKGAGRKTKEPGKKQGYTCSSLYFRSC